MSASRPELANFHASLLWQLVEDLHIDFTAERSMRVCRQSLQVNRFLLTIAKEKLGNTCTEKILTLWRRLAMPDALVEVGRQNLDRARFLHFGFEEGPSSFLYKVYLEFPVSATPQAAPILLHLAFKWDSAAHVQTQYVWHPGLNLAAIAGRLADLYQGTGECYAIAKSILGLSAGRRSELVNYLEVSEDANGRRSFDINMYDVELRMRNLAPQLERMGEYFAVPAQPFAAHLDSIKDCRFGHLAGGKHRDGQEFFNLYYGAEPRQGNARPVRAGWVQGNLKRLQVTNEQDQYYNYCWWPYLPVAATENKFRCETLLWHSFSVAGVEEGAGPLVETIQAEIGRCRTVWGAKWLPAAPHPADGGPPVEGRLAWEFYFYDYQRRQRDVSISRVLKTIQPILACSVPANERLPYFMFSLDVSRELLAAGELDTVHMYIGNVGSKVSSGIAYAVTKAGTSLENFYFFFDAHRDLREAAEKICSSAYVDAASIDIDRLLWPELRDCHTICVANKRGNDTVYFSGINVDQLLFFLRKLRYPAEIIDHVSFHRDKLDHLLYDVGYDYISQDSELRIVKSGYYGVF